MLKRIVFTSLVTVAVFSALPFLVEGRVLAANIISRGEVPYDETLSDQTLNDYGSVKNIAVVKISASAPLQFDDDGEWVKGLYYYMITRLRFTDIPFNYIVSWQGNIYSGKGGGNEVQPPLSDESQSRFPGTIVVAYFDNGREMTNSGQQALADVLEDALSLAQINPSAVFAADVSVSTSTDVVPVSGLSLDVSTEAGWVETVDEIKSSLSPAPAGRTYQATVSSVDFPASVAAGQSFVTSVTLQNTGLFPWYNLGDRVAYLVTSDPRGHDSRFYVSDDWASFSRVASFTEEWVLPGESTTVEFSIRTPLVAGEYSEKFEVLVSPDQWVEGSQFEVRFTVSPGDFKLVEILDTETGSLNVRDCPSQNCGEVGMVVPGDILINLGQENGWYLVRFNDTQEGWVYGKYVREI